MSDWLTASAAKDKAEYFHNMLAATIVAPGHNRAVRLEPEFIVPQDGHAGDCESRATPRWLAAHGAHYRRFNLVYLADDLSSCQPICWAFLAAGFLFVRKPGSHPAIEEFRARHPTRRPGHAHPARKEVNVPLRGDAKAIDVNRLSIDDAAVTYRNRFITYMVHHDTIVATFATARAQTSPGVSPIGFTGKIRLSELRLNRISKAQK